MGRYVGVCFPVFSTCFCISMGFLWDFYWIFMKFLWNPYGHSYGSTVGFLWVSFMVSMIFLLDFYAISMRFLLDSYRNPIGIS